jgi:hypothetical protein
VRQEKAESTTPQIKRLTDGCFAHERTIPLDANNDKGVPLAEAFDGIRRPSVWRQKSPVDEFSKAASFLGPAKQGFVIFGRTLASPTKQEEAMSIPRGTGDGSLF